MSLAQGWANIVQHVHEASWSQLAHEFEGLGIVYLVLGIGGGAQWLYFRWVDRRRRRQEDQDIAPAK